MSRRSIALGVLDLVPVPAAGDDAAALRQAATLARSAEAWGYRRYWAAEHHDMAGLACAAPEVLLAHIGATTSRIRLGTGALLLPHYRPLKVAETFRLLASLYPGRIDLGMGRAPGGSAHVSMALSGNFLEHVRRLPESLRAMNELMTDTYRYEGEPVRARPMPPEQPELWLLGTNRKSAEYAAEFGMGYVLGRFMSDHSGEETLRSYREAFAPSPLRSGPRAMVAIGVVCAPTADAAAELARSLPAPFVESAGDGGEPALEDRKLLVGSPAEVADSLRRLSALYGVDEFLVTTMVADFESRLRSYELLAQAML